MQSKTLVTLNLGGLRGLRGVRRELQLWRLPLRCCQCRQLLRAETLLGISPTPLDSRAATFSLRAATLLLSV